MTGSKYIVPLTHPERVSKIYSYPPTCLKLVKYHYKQEQFGIYENFSAIFWKNGHKSGVPRDHQASTPITIMASYQWQYSRRHHTNFMLFFGRWESRFLWHFYSFLSPDLTFVAISRLRRPFAVSRPAFRPDVGNSKGFAVIRFLVRR